MSKKAIDALWTSQWAVKKKLVEEPEDKYLLEIKKQNDIALEALKAVPSIAKQEPPKTKPIAIDEDLTKVDETPGIPSEAAIGDPVFVRLKGVNFKESSYATPSKMFEGMVVHYTVSGRSAKSAEGVAKYLASKNLGCMVMDEDGIIYIPESFDVFKDAAAHAGASKWNGRNGLNRFYCGLEVCGWGRADKANPAKGLTRFNDDPKHGPKGYYQPFTAKQEQAILNLIAYFKKKNPHFKIENIAGHHEVAPGRKQDPGASLSFTMDELRSKAKNV